MAKTYKAGPRKVAPMHPGEVMQGVLDDMRVSGREAAAAIGMSVNGLAKVLRGDTPVTTETALRIGTYFGNGPDLWLNMQRELDLWHARAKLAGELSKIKPLKLARKIKTGTAGD